MSAHLCRCPFPAACSAQWALQMSILPVGSPISYNMERPYVGRTLSRKLAWPHVLQQNLSKTMEKRDDFTVWPDKAL